MGTVLTLIIFFGVGALLTPKEKLRELERAEAKEAEREGRVWQSR